MILVKLLESWRTRAGTTQHQPCSLLAPSASTKQSRPSASQGVSFAAVYRCVYCYDAVRATLPDGCRQQAADQAGQWTCCHLALDTCSCRLQARHAPKKRSPACMMCRITLCNFMMGRCCGVVRAMRGCMQQQALQYAIPCRKVARQLALQQLGLKTAALSHP